MVTEALEQYENDRFDSLTNLPDFKARRADANRLMKARRVSKLKSLHLYY